MKKDIVISDMDIVDVNVNTAKEFILKARWIEDGERKAKCLFLARKAIDNSLSILGVENIRIENTRQPTKTDGQNKLIN